MKDSSHTSVTQLSAELLAEVRSLHFQTNNLADEGIAGQYKSAFRGRGIEFEEVREYKPGDDVRSIDWKVTARSQKVYVKSYREERELTVMIAVDVSASNYSGTRKQLKDSLAAKVGAFLTLIAQKNNDHVGLLTFSDQVETFFPPRKARSAVWRILHTVLSPGAKSKQTDLAEMLAFLNRVLKRSSIVFLVSDFTSQNVSEDYEKQLAILAKKHDVTAISISDLSDYRLPDVGVLQVQEPESGREYLIDTSDTRVREQYEVQARTNRETFSSVCGRYKVGFIELFTDLPFVPEIRKFLSNKRAHSFKSDMRDLS